MSLLRVEILSWSGWIMFRYTPIVSSNLFSEGSWMWEKYLWLLSGALFRFITSAYQNCHSFSFQQSNKDVDRILSVRLYYLLQVFSVLLQTFRPKKRFEPGTLRYSLHKQAQASLSSGINLRSVVQLPQGEDSNDWIAVHGKLTACFLKIEVLKMVMSAIFFVTYKWDHKFPLQSFTI